ncbi:MAG: TFIIB-type zinc ribbon-containing protein [Streptococcaceae bacterium]|jgi:DNA-directed RNA polymerase subunit RPC12/RpoP|nr:TFIIB-type zinc ribbon-containing protein [Streptococcaceae bacterium]
MSEAQTHRCLNCGGYLTFEPNDQKFHCPYCLSIFTEAEIQTFANSQTQTASETQSNEGDPKKQIKLYQCNSCGAQVYTDATTAATFCYYCHNPVVLVERLSGEFAPQKLIPFQLDKERANALFAQWIKHQHYVDKNFYSKEQVEKLSGVYFPFWYMESESVGKLSATGKKLRIWRVGDLEYTETKIFAVIRVGLLHFTDLLKSALTKNLNQKMFSNVEPFDFSALVDFKTPYLAGFMAEKRDIEYQEMADEVKSEITQYSKSLITSEASREYTSLHQDKFTLEDDTTPKYLLLPLWVLTYHHNDKLYYFAINGQTGKISGVLPTNHAKLLLHAVVICLIILVIGLFVGYLI